MLRSWAGPIRCLIAMSLACVSTATERDPSTAPLPGSVQVQEPRSAAEYHKRGQERYARGDLTGSIADYRKAIEINSGFSPRDTERTGSNVSRRLAVSDSFNASVCNDLGLALRMNGDIQEALSILSLAIQMNPRLAPAYSNRGSVWQDVGKFDKAEADLNTAIRLQPSLASAYNNRANLRVRQRRPEDALPDYDRAIALNPGNARTWANRGLTLISLGREDEGLRDLNRCLAIDPRLKPHLEELARQEREIRQNGTRGRGRLPLVDPE